MYKTVKIPEEAYKEAKILSKELEKSREIVGVYNVNLSTAISYAIEKMLESIKKRKRFLSAAGGWKDMENVDKLIEEIYKDRLISTRKEVNL